METNFATQPQIDFVLFDADEFAEWESVSIQSWINADPEETEK